MMAFSVQEYGGNPTKMCRFFLCDTRSDIASLPTNSSSSADFPNGTPPNSSAFVIADSSVWILSNAGVWSEI